MLQLKNNYIAILFKKESLFYFVTSNQDTSHLITDAIYQICVTFLSIFEDRHKFTILYMYNIMKININLRLSLPRNRLSMYSL